MLLFSQRSLHDSTLRPSPPLIVAHVGNLRRGYSAIMLPVQDRRYAIECDAIEATSYLLNSSLGTPGREIGQHKDDSAN